MQQKIVIIGPAHPLRGGLASFNERLATQFIQNNNPTTLYTFSLQYPKFLFRAPANTPQTPNPKTLILKSASTPSTPSIGSKSASNSKKTKPDIIIVRYWLPFLAPCLGTILKIVKKNKHTKIICIADNIIPHEKRIGDFWLTKFFVNSVHHFITMSHQVSNDLHLIFKKQSQTILHPLYDNFGPKINKIDARNHLQLPQNEKIILFFGFIREYKGLDLLLQAINTPIIKNHNIKLLIAGEFYEDSTKYTHYIKTHHLEKNLYLHTHFIPNNQIQFYLSACDFVIQPYKKATQSGVTPLAYHFEKATLVTNVGGLTNIVIHQKTGIISSPTPPEIANNIIQMYQLGENHFIPHIQHEKQKLSWNTLANTILSLK